MYTWLVSSFSLLGRTLICLLNVATFGAEISDSGKLLPTLTTLFEKKWPANFVLVLLTKKIFEYPLSSLWRSSLLSAGVFYNPLTFIGFNQVCFCPPLLQRFQLNIFVCTGVGIFSAPSLVIS